MMTRLDSNKNKYRNLSAGWAQGGREVTRCKSTVGSWRPLDSSALLCLTCPSASPRLSVRLTCPTRRQHWWLMVPRKAENHSSQWQTQRSQRAEPFITLCYQLLTLWVPALMMIIRSNHNLNNNPTAACAQGLTLSYTRFRPLKDPETLKKSVWTNFPLELRRKKWAANRPRQEGREKQWTSADSLINDHFFCLPLMHLAAPSWQKVLVYGPCVWTHTHPSWFIHTQRHRSITAKL